jgi:hypothetical protein
MRTLPLLVLLTAVLGCTNAGSPADSATPASGDQKQSVPLSEPVTPKKPEPPAYTNEQLAGVYKMVFTKEELAEANANGLDLTRDVPTITFEKDGTFVMGSTGSPGTVGEGTFKVEGEEIVLTLLGEGDRPDRESPRIKVTQGGKMLEFASGANGRPVRLERA